MFLSVKDDSAFENVFAARDNDFFKPSLQYFEMGNSAISLLILSHPESLIKTSFLMTGSYSFAGIAVQQYILKLVLY